MSEERESLPVRTWSVTADKMREHEGWAAIAQELATKANQDHFEDHFEVWILTDTAGRTEALCYIDSNPYSADGGAPYDREDSRRGRLLAAFRTWLREGEIPELAVASYPDDGYTVAVVFEAHDEHLVAVLRQLSHLQREAMK